MGVGNNVGRLLISSVVNVLYNTMFVIKPRMTEETAGVVVTFHNIRGSKEQTD